MKRGDARELAVHLIYGRAFTGEEPEQVVSTRLNKEYYGKLAEENEVYAQRPDRFQLRYIDSVVTGVANREDELDDVIRQFSIGWDISRISKLARCILRLAIYEILYVDDVPTGVVVAEAVRIAKKYDGDDTGAFINGILGSFVRSRNTENLPILRELFYTNLLDGRIEPGTERDRAARLDIDLRGEEWAVGLAYIGSDNSRDALSTLSVQNLLEETLTADRCRLSLYNDWVALIVSLTEAFTIYDLIRSLDRACTLAASYLGLTLTVGVGAPCRELSGMARSSAEARTALEYRSMVGRGQVIYIGDLEPDGGPVLSFEEADERALTAAIKLGNEEEIRQAAAALAGKIRQANPAAGQYHLFLMELVTHLLKMTRRSGVGVEEVFGTDFSLPMQEPALPALAELEDWCAERCLRLHTLIRRRQTDTAGHTVETAKEYIRQHYAESDLSVEKLCAYLHLSSTYFSTLFKRETGTTFTAYVTTVRMEAAAEAIRTTEEKTYLIARQCGYEDPNYFSYVFKRHFGATPTKYRSEGK